MHAKGAECYLENQDQITVLPTGQVTSPIGFYAGGLHCGLKRKRKDLGVIYSQVPAVCCGVYTTNKFQAAPLQVTQASLQVEGKLQAIVVNSGNANACTGSQGLADARQMQAAFATRFDLKAHHVGVVSTGIIGERLPLGRIEQGISNLNWSKQADNFQEAILTTDISQKHLAVQLTVNGKVVTIGGAAKGSGMIHPNMATMLGFITTDAVIDQVSLQQALAQVTDRTFNMITVDGDTSTNDMVLVMANGLAGNRKLNCDHPAWPQFLTGLEIVCQHLAKQIARDGEGATKLVEVQVLGASNLQDAKAVAKTVISSNLVKTAIYGVDPNWGRIVCAVGYSKAQLDPDKVTVDLGKLRLFEDGVALDFDEAVAKDYLSQDTIQITIDLQEGDYSAVAWGCDLSYDYVRINAQYRT